MVMMGFWCRCTSHPRDAQVKALHTHGTAALVPNGKPEAVCTTCSLLQHAGSPGKWGLHRGVAAAAC